MATKRLQNIKDDLQWLKYVEYCGRIAYFWCGFSREIKVIKSNGNNIFKLLGFGVIVADQTFVDWADENNLKCCLFVPESELCDDWKEYEDEEARFGPGLRYDLC